MNGAFPLFYSPLYLGKASDQSLRSRLKHHANRFLGLWERYARDQQFIDRLTNPKDFAERAIKLGFAPDDLCCMTLAIDAGADDSVAAQDIGGLIDAAEWLLNRWTTPILGRQ